ncbi:protease complex subunit PrcB family protein [Paenactinomyces guangxiensis]|uniref:Protease complex subunit PrcB family protein n=1 Tax=Paenactinomyces guangxiensis TaxID=1490290 RepID=A0A7W2A998_9BACL|nr:protease complex subunit PrcB family protein [Paenactinomyces guangxiensis]MBA4494957.1 protease complex subunit PrcB family protein [Paenactinomyces guangxiensis]MBH8592040.1 protease complex subunit PrcB family protein [Paenactinomyces guangxiensis]
MSSQRQRSFEPKFRIISLKEQKKLPLSVTEWVHERKTVRGVSEYRRNKYSYLMISLGSRPNPGYRLELVKVETGRKETAVFVEEKFPLPGRMYPQVVVYPYLLAEVRGPVQVCLIRPDQSVVPFS